MSFIPRYNVSPLEVAGGCKYPAASRIKSLFTYKSKFEDIFFLYKEKNGHIYLPRNCCPLESVNDKRVSGVPVKFDINFVPRKPSQTVALEKMVQLLKQGVSHVCQAPTGWGKSFVGAAVIGHIGKKTLIVVTKEDVKFQWRDALIKTLGLSPDDIGYIQGDVYNVTGKKVVIAMIQSIHKDERYPSWVFMDFGLVVFDEIHLMAADKFSRAAWHLPAKLRLGLSATAYRKDGKDVVFHAHIGKVLVEIEGIPMIPKIFVVSTKTNIGWVYHTPGRIAKVNNVLMKTKKRNGLIAKYIKIAYDKERNSVVFSDLREHLEILQTELVAIGCKLNDIGFYVGGMSEDELNVSSRKKIVLATYKMCSYATDRPWWDAAFLCTPHSDVIQIVGRILREYENKKTPVVFDFVDSGSEILSGYANSRRRWYKSVGAEMQYLSAI